MLPVCCLKIPSRRRSDEVWDGLADDVKADILAIAGRRRCRHARRWEMNNLCRLFAGSCRSEAQRFNVVLWQTALAPAAREFWPDMYCRRQLATYGDRIAISTSLRPRSSGDRCNAVVRLAVSPACRHTRKHRSEHFELVIDLFCIPCFEFHGLLFEFIVFCNKAPPVALVSQVPRSAQLSIAVVSPRVPLVLLSGRPALRFRWRGVNEAVKRCHESLLPSRPCPSSWTS